ncbi:MAG: cytochrome ubiquinol oxidase subunit I, partial [Bacilli bacterium]
VYYRKTLRLTMICSFIFAVATAINGDAAGKYLAEYQPIKLAAAEWHFETEESAKLILGGILDEETSEVKYGLGIPFALSILAYGNPTTEVIGLNDFPRELWPPLYVHYLFDVMVAIGMFLTVVSGLFLLFRYWKKRNEWNRMLLWLIFLGGPLSMLAIEFGWIFTEVGRQPWVLVGVMKTIDGATTASNVGSMLILFGSLYLFLGVFSTLVLLRMFKSKPAELEMQERSIK